MTMVSVYIMLFFFFHGRPADGIGINPAQTAGELLCCFGAHALGSLCKATFSTEKKTKNNISAAFIPPQKPSVRCFSFHANVLRCLGT